MSSAKQLYNRFTNLCHNWPLDKGKTGRDYAELFRKQLAAKFPQGELSSLDEPHIVESQIQALENLASNKYCSNVTRLKYSTAMGVDPKLCDVAVSNGILEDAKQFSEESFVTQVRVLFLQPYVDPQEDKSSLPTSSNSTTAKIDDVASNNKHSAH